jgi:hypothetical protein
MARSVHIHIEVSFGKDGKNNVKYEADATSDKGDADKKALEGVFGEFIGIGLGLTNIDESSAVVERISQDELTGLRSEQKAGDMQHQEMEPLEEELQQDAAPLIMGDDGLEGDNQ